MDPEVQDESQVLETETTEEVTETTEEAQPEEDIEAIKAKAAKADELEKKNKQLFERAKKAEEAAKAKPEATDLSARDALILAKADVHQDDIEEILDYAKYKGISVADALNAPVIKTLVSERADERRTASVTQTKSARGTSKVSGEDLLAKAEKTGEIPESEEGLQELFKARQKARLNS